MANELKRTGRVLRHAAVPSTPARAAYWDYAYTTEVTWLSGIVSPDAASLMDIARFLMTGNTRDMSGGMQAGAGYYDMTIRNVLYRTLYRYARVPVVQYSREAVRWPPTPAVAGQPARTEIVPPAGWTAFAHSLRWFNGPGWAEFVVPAGIDAATLGLSYTPFSPTHGWAHMHAALRFTGGEAYRTDTGEALGTYGYGVTWRVRATSGGVQVLRNGHLTATLDAPLQDRPTFLAATLYSYGDRVVDPKLGQEQVAGMPPPQRQPLPLPGASIPGAPWRWAGTGNLPALRAQGWAQGVYKAHTAPTAGFKGAALPALRLRGKTASWGYFRLRGLRMQGFAGRDARIAFGAARLPAARAAGIANALPPVQRQARGLLGVPALHLRGEGVPPPRADASLALGALAAQGFTHLAAQGRGRLSPLWLMAAVGARDQARLSTIGWVRDPSERAAGAPPLPGDGQPGRPGMGLTAGVGRLVVLVDGARVSDVALSDRLLHAALREQAQVQIGQAFEAVMGAVLQTLAQVHGLRVEPVQGHTLVWNPQTGGTTRYDRQFDSLTCIGGRYYGANAQGLWRLEGDSDAGQPVNARLGLGQPYLGSTQLKRLEGCYLALASDGRMLLHVGAGGQGWTYRARSFSPHERAQRIDTGKGLRETVLNLTLLNEQGADFELHGVELRLAGMTRRI